MDFLSLSSDERFQMISSASVKNVQRNNYWFAVAVDFTFELEILRLKSLRVCLRIFAGRESCCKLKWSCIGSIRMRVLDGYTIFLPQSIVLQSTMERKGIVLSETHCSISSE